MRPGRRGFEDGVSLVELMVAVAILGILLTGLSRTIVSALDLSRNNAHRVVASNLAAGAIDELRALPFSDLEDLADTDPDPTWTEEVDGRDFTLTRSIYWSSNLADAGACLGSIGPADENILRLSIEATWRRALGEGTVTTETAVSPPLSPDSSDSGTIAVFVADHQSPPVGVQNVQVVLTGPDPSTVTATEMTDANGCAVFQGLPRGDYEASLSRSGTTYDFIDIDQRVSPDVTSIIGTAPRIWANLEFRFSEAGALTAQPAGWAAGSELPSDPLPWYANNEREGSPYEFASTASPGLLFPGLYELGVGACTDTAIAPRMDDPATVESGTASNAAVTIGSFEVRWSAAVQTALAVDGVVARDVTLYAIPPADPCYDGVGEIELPSMTEGETGRIFALPFSNDWEISARVAAGQLDVELVSLSPDDATSTLPFVEFDYDIEEPADPVDPDPDESVCGDLFTVPPGFIDAQGGSIEVVTVAGIPYCQHTFDEPGSVTFSVVSGSGEIEVAVIAGGGGGGVFRGGGGGAGGVSLANGLVVGGGDSFPVVVGAGGAGGQGGSAGVASGTGADGADSSFGAVSAEGGGGGGRGVNDNNAGRDGGSGGGAGGAAAAAGPGSGIAGQGFDGGESTNVSYGTSNRRGGGGGGAGTSGVDATGSGAGNGGAGLSIWGNFYAGGGGAATNDTGDNQGDGGIGGGGDGRANGAGSPGAPGTGGGGGAAGGGYEAPHSGGAGGSGVVLVRYPLDGPAVVDCDASPLVINAAGSQQIAVPVGCSEMEIEAWGAGGGGGNPGGQFDPAGAGGGAGAFAGGTYTVTEGALYDITVGSGGGPQSGGGDTSVGSLVRARGGGGGGTGAGGGGSAVGSTGQVTQAGGDGGARGVFGSFGGGGGGGGSATATSGGQDGGNGGNYTGGNGGVGQGNGGRGGDDADGSGPKQAGSGSAPGGGGGGRGWFTNTSGGSGADGRVVIRWSGP